jgi:hypothetical protein
LRVRARQISTNGSGQRGLHSLGELLAARIGK